MLERRDTETGVPPHKGVISGNMEMAPIHPGDEGRIRWTAGEEGGNNSESNESEAVAEQSRGRQTGTEGTTIRGLT